MGDVAEERRPIYLAVVWTIVGGAGTMFGPLVGTTLFIVIREIVSSHWEHHSLIVGLLAILAVIFAPKGIVGLWNGWMTRLGERDAASAPPRLTLQAEP